MGMRQGGSGQSTVIGKKHDLAAAGVDLKPLAVNRKKLVNLICIKFTNILVVVRTVDDDLVGVGNGKFIGDNPDFPARLVLFTIPYSHDFRRRHRLVSAAENANGRLPLIYLWPMLVRTGCPGLGNDNPTLGFDIRNEFGHKISL